MTRKTFAVPLLALVLLAAFPLAAAAERFDCVPRAVSERDNRIDVRCENAFTPAGTRTEVVFIAIDKRDADRANRFASMATAALTCGYIFRVDIPASATSNVDGCRADDCRTPTVFGIARD